MALALATACEQEQRQLERGKVAQLLRQIDQLRQAENERKAPYLMALKAADCGPAPACELKRVCVKAYERHIEGTDAIRAIKHELSTDAGDNPGQSARLLRKSKLALEKARKLSERCAERQAVVRYRYEL